MTVETTSEVPVAATASNVPLKKLTKKRKVAATNEEPVKTTPLATSSTTTTTTTTTTPFKQGLAEKKQQVESAIQKFAKFLLVQALNLAMQMALFAISLIPTTIKEQIQKFITNHRDIFICIVLVPASALYDAFWFLRRMYLYRVRQTQTKSSHMQRVAVVQDQILDCPPDSRMCTARPTWLTMSLKEGVYKSYMRNIDLSSLDNVLSIDPVKMTVHVEPNCTMGQVTKELIPLGWTMAVVPELDDLTVGGLINGFGIESSSHKYGLFQHACVAFEIVLPNGEYVRATEDSNPELFACIPWSHGTLGFLVGAEIKIVPAKEFVHMTYLPCYSLESMVNTFTYASESSAFDFVEMLTYSKDTAVVMVGKMASRLEANQLYEQRLVSRPEVNAIGNYYKPWFYKHVAAYVGIPSSANDLDDNLLKLEYLATLFSGVPWGVAENVHDLAFKVESTKLAQELIPLRDYYHRHTRSLFWELADIVPFGNEPWFRYLFGWAFPPHLSLMKLTTTEDLREMYEKAHVVQDMLVPINTLLNSLLKFDDELQLYPLWVCPMRLLTPPTSFWGSELSDVDPPLQPLSSASVLAKDEKYELTCSVPGGLVNPTPENQLYVDIGAYGVPNATQWKAVVKKIYGPEKVEDPDSVDENDIDPELHVKVMRRIEKFVRDNHGYQALYADCFQSQEEFRQMFDHNLYDQLRDKYGCNGRLPTIYDKVSRKARK